MTGDPLFDALRALPEHTPAAGREAHIRAACHARIRRGTIRRQIATRLLQGATAAALCVYLTSVLSAALRVALGAPAG